MNATETATCAICQEELSTPDTYWGQWRQSLPERTFQLECDHKMHRMCIQKWIDSSLLSKPVGEKGQCPICRKAINLQCTSEHAFGLINTIWPVFRKATGIGLVSSITLIATELFKSLGISNKATLCLSAVTTAVFTGKLVSKLSSTEWVKKKSFPLVLSVYNWWHDRDASIKNLDIRYSEWSEEKMNTNIKESICKGILLLLESPSEGFDYVKNPNIILNEQLLAESFRLFCEEHPEALPTFRDHHFTTMPYIEAFGNYLSFLVQREVIQPLQPARSPRTE